MCNVKCFFFCMAIFKFSTKREEEEEEEKKTLREQNFLKFFLRKIIIMIFIIVIVVVCCNYSERKNNRTLQFVPPFGESPPFSFLLLYKFSRRVLMCGIFFLTFSHVSPCHLSIYPSHNFFNVTNFSGNNDRH